MLVSCQCCYCVDVVDIQITVPVYVFVEDANGNKEGCFEVELKLV